MNAYSYYIQHCHSDVLRPSGCPFAEKWMFLFTWSGKPPPTVTVLGVPYRRTVMFEQLPS